MHFALSALLNEICICVHMRQTLAKRAGLRRLIRLVKIKTQEKHWARHRKYGPYPVCYGCTSNVSMAKTGLMTQQGILPKPLLFSITLLRNCSPHVLPTSSMSLAIKFQKMRHQPDWFPKRVHAFVLLFHSVVMS